MNPKKAALREVGTMPRRRRRIIVSAAALCIALGSGACALDIRGQMTRDAGLGDPRTDERVHEAITEDVTGDAGDIDREEGDERVEDAGLDPELLEVFDAFTDPEIDPLDADPEDPADSTEEEELPAECAGVMVGGYCWYVSAMDASCTAACAAHGGCDPAGTRDYAGSGGSDAHCVAVLEALGYGGYPHQDFSNNDLGCHFAWLSYTYWSTEDETTCEAAPFIGETDPSVYRMCACER
jgi:hypothetical protein